MPRLYYLITGYDELGLPIDRKIIEATEVSMIAIVEMRLHEQAAVESFEVDVIDCGPRGTLTISRVYETRVPF